MAGMNGRERVLAFLQGQPVDRLPLMPVVMMFCADQIGVKYGEYVKDYRVLAEAQIRTAEMFDFDDVSIMSDPAREAFDCGAHVEFYEDQPAAIVESDALLADKSRLARLQLPDPLAGGRMHGAVLGLELMKSRVGHEKILMGWVEGPCAEAADLRGINTLMLDFYDDPAFVRDLFDFVIEMELRYAQAQIDAGADLIGDRRRRGVPDRAEVLRRVCLALRKEAGGRTCTLWGPTCGCTSAATQIGSSTGWDAWVAKSSTWTTSLRWRKPAARWAPTRRCWETSIRSRWSATVLRPARNHGGTDPNATRRPAPGSSSAAGCENPTRIRRWKTYRHDGRLRPQIVRVHTRLVLSREPPR